MGKIDKQLGSSPASNVIRQNEFIPITAPEAIQGMQFTGYSDTDPQIPERVAYPNIIASIPQGTIKRNMLQGYVPDPAAVGVPPYIPSESALVTSPQIADNSVTPTKIPNLSLTNNKLAGGITKDKIVSIAIGQVEGLVTYFDKIVFTVSDLLSLASGAYKNVLVTSGTYALSAPLPLSETIQKLVLESGASIDVTIGGNASSLFGSLSTDIQGGTINLSAPFATGTGGQSSFGVLAKSIKDCNVAVTATSYVNPGNTSGCAIQSPWIENVSFSNNTYAMPFANAVGCKVMDCVVSYSPNAAGIISIANASLVRNVSVQFNGTPGTAAYKSTNITGLSTSGNINECQYVTNCILGNAAQTEAAIKVEWLTNSTLFGRCNACNHVLNNRITIFSKSTGALLDCSFAGYNEMLFEAGGDATGPYVAATSSRKITNNSLKVNASNPISQLPTVTWPNSYATWQLNGSYAANGSPNGGFNEGVWTNDVVPTLTVDWVKGYQDQLIFSVRGGSSNITITSNIGWTVTAVS